MKKTTPSKAAPNKKLRTAIAYLQATENFEAAEESQIQLIDALSTRAATGDAVSFNLLVKLAVGATSAVNDLTKSNFETAREVARRSVFWPTLIAQSRHILPIEKDIVKRLELGRVVPISVNLERAFKTKNDSRQIAIYLLFLTDDLRTFSKNLERKLFLDGVAQKAGMASSDDEKSLISLSEAQLPRIIAIVNENWSSAISNLNGLACFLKIQPEMRKQKLEAFAKEAYALPVLEKSTITAWVKFGKQVIDFLTDERPQDNKVLRKIGDYRRDAYYRKDAPTGTKFLERKKIAKAKQTEVSNIRDGIFTRIGEAYKKVLKEKNGH